MLIVRTTQRTITRGRHKMLKELMKDAAKQIKNRIDQEFDLEMTGEMENTVANIAEACTDAIMPILTNVPEIAAFLDKNGRDEYGECDQDYGGFDMYIFSAIEEVLNKPAEAAPSEAPEGEGE